MATRTDTPVFDYRLLRFLIGVVAFVMPILVSNVAPEALPSISASYHYDESRDWFVGMLFVVGAFLLAYNGHFITETIWSSVAGIAAFFVALCPTAICGAESTLISKIHFAAAFGLFGILTYFCFGPFPRRISGWHGACGRRRSLYYLCGAVMLVAMLAIAAGKWMWPPEKVCETRLVYWGEFFALGAFGVAWFIAGKVRILGLFVDRDEAYMKLRK